MTVESRAIRVGSVRVPCGFHVGSGVSFVIIMCQGWFIVMTSVPRVLMGNWVRVHRNSLYYLCHFAKVSMYPHSERKLIHGVIVSLIHGVIVSQVCSHSNLSCSTPFRLGCIEAPNRL